MHPGHRRGRWAATAAVVALMAISAAALGLCSRNGAKDSASMTDSLNVALRVSMLRVDSLLDAGDNDPSRADLLYIAARREIAAADSLAASGATAAIPDSVRRRADNSLAAAALALEKQRALFDDMPRYAADIDRRIAALDSVSNLYTAKK